VVIERRDKATTLEMLAGFLLNPMNRKQDEIIFGANRGGVTWLRSFADRAELDSAREKAERLALSLSQMLCGPYPKDQRIAQGDLRMRTGNLMA
jgi:hypothetical protein